MCTRVFFCGYLHWKTFIFQVWSSPLDSIYLAVVLMCALRAPACCARAMSRAEELMGCEDRDVRVFALDTYAKLAEIELALLTALGEAPTDDRNPLARRVRLDR